MNDINFHKESNLGSAVENPTEQTRIGHRGLPATVHEISDDEEDGVSEETSESEEESSDAELGKLY